MNSLSPREPSQLPPSKKNDALEKEEDPHNKDDAQPEEDPDDGHSEDDGVEKMREAKLIMDRAAFTAQHQGELPLPEHDHIEEALEELEEAAIGLDHFLEVEESLNPVELAEHSEALARTGDAYKSELEPEQSKSLEIVGFGTGALLAGIGTVLTIKKSKEAWHLRKKIKTLQKANPQDTAKIAKLQEKYQELTVEASLSGIKAGCETSKGTLHGLSIFTKVLNATAFVAMQILGFIAGGLNIAIAGYSLHKIGKKKKIIYEKFQKLNNLSAEAQKLDPPSRDVAESLVLFRKASLEKDLKDLEVSTVRNAFFLSSGVLGLTSGIMTYAGIAGVIGATAICATGIGALVFAGASLLLGLSYYLYKKYQRSSYNLKKSLATGDTPQAKIDARSLSLAQRFTSINAVKTAREKILKQKKNQLEIAITSKQDSLNNNGLDLDSDNLILINEDPVDKVAVKQHIRTLQKKLNPIDQELHILNQQAPNFLSKYLEKLEQSTAETIVKEGHFKKLTAALDRCGIAVGELEKAKNKSAYLLRLALATE